MELKRFYEEISGDYEGTLARLMTEERIKKFLRKFAAAKEYEELKKSIESKNSEELFLLSHSIKGMCANLGLSKLQDSSSRLCEAVRNGVNVSEEELLRLCSALKADYDKAIDAIAEIEG